MVADDVEAKRDEDNRDAGKHQEPTAPCRLRPRNVSPSACSSGRGAASIVMSERGTMHSFYVLYKIEKHIVSAVNMSRPAFSPPGACAHPAEAGTMAREYLGQATKTVRPGERGRIWRPGRCRPSVRQGACRRPAALREGARGTDSPHRGRTMVTGMALAAKSIWHTNCGSARGRCAALDLPRIPY